MTTSRTHQHPSTLDGMIAHLQTIRTAIGYDVDLYVMNSTYHTYEIRQVARDINDRYVLIRTEM